MRVAFVQQTLQSDRGRIEAEALRLGPIAVDEAAAHHNREVRNQQARELPTDAPIHNRTAILRPTVHPRRSDCKLVADSWVVERKRSREKTVSRDAVRGGRMAAQHRCSDDEPR
jgi:hypothetical protein